MMSALPPKADIGTQSWNVRFVPKADSCTATNSRLFDHLVGERYKIRRQLDACDLCGGHDVTHLVENPTRSEGWRRAITADTPCTTLERSVGLLDGNDKDWGAGLEICPVPHVVNDDGRIGRHKDFLFTVFVRASASDRRRWRPPGRHSRLSSCSAAGDPTGSVLLRFHALPLEKCAPPRHAGCRRAAAWR